MHGDGDGPESAFRSRRCADLVWMGADGFLLLAACLGRPLLLRHRRRPIAECGIDDGSHAERDFIFIRPSSNLYADGKAFRRTSHGNHGRGRAERVEPLRMSDGIEIADLTALDSPRTLAGTKGRNGGHRTEQYRKRSHLGEHLGADQIELGPGTQQIRCGELWARLCDLQKLAEDGAEQVSRPWISGA